MKKHASDRKRAAAAPVSARRKPNRQLENLERSNRRRPRRLDDPFREPETDDLRVPRNEPARHDRHTSRNQLRTWEKGWAVAEPEEDGSDRSGLRSP